MTDAELEHAFRQPHYLALNKARLDHLGALLDTLHFDPKGKTVLDLGAGIGDLAVWWRDRGADVLCVDGRPENVDYMKRRGLKTRLCDFENEFYFGSARYDVVFAYGVLHHCSLPELMVAAIKANAKNLVLIETMISASVTQLLITENRFDPSQSLSGMGSRPSLLSLHESFARSNGAFAMIAFKQPHHPDYEEGRRVVIAARRIRA